MADYPRTAAILSGGSFVVHADDADADDAERGVLRRVRPALRARGSRRGAHGSWLVEIYADDETAPLEPWSPPCGCSWRKRCAAAAASSAAQAVA